MAAPNTRRTNTVLSSFGKLAVVAVESSGCSAAGLVRYLRSQGMRVLEVNQPHAHPRRRSGKSDPLDAELAARLALAGKVGAIPEQTDGIVESIRQLRVARQGVVKARSAAMAQLRDLIVTASEPLREQLSGRKTIRGKASPRMPRIPATLSAVQHGQAPRAGFPGKQANGAAGGGSPHTREVAGSNPAAPCRRRALQLGLASGRCRKATFVAERRSERQGQSQDPEKSAARDPRLP